MQFIDLGKLPISDAKPAGDDARYEPEYDELQQEVDKLSSATAGGGVDWKRAAKLAYVILSKKSKDIKVAAYLAVALIHLKQVDGLSTGVQVMLDMVNTYWDTLYPAKKRMRGRFNAVAWWSEAAEKFLSNYDGPEINQASSEVLVRRIKDLDQALSGKSEDAPMLNRLVDLAGGLPVQAPEVQAEEEAQDAARKEAEAKVQEHQEATRKVVEASATSAHKTAAPAVTPAPVGDIGSHEEYRQALKDGLAGLGTVADYLLTNDPADRGGTG